MELDRWPGVEFRHLVALAAIAEEGSVSGAADRLGYVQSAVSRQLFSLERTVGTRLIERTRGQSGVTLTPAGFTLLGHVKKLVAELGAAHADLRALEDQHAGTVRLGVSAGLEARLVPGVLSRLLRRPDTSLETRPLSDDEAALSLIADGELDVAVLSRPRTDGPFAYRRVLADPYVLLTQANSPLARRGVPPTAAELSAIPLIDRRAGSDTRAAHEDLRLLGAEPRVVFQTDDDATVHALVRRGIGAAILPALSVDRCDAGTVALVFEEPLRPRTIWLCVHAQRDATPALEVVCEALQAVGAAAERELAGWVATATPRELAGGGIA